MADIYQDIEAEIPRLRRYARALVRDVAAADDLVQECLTRALAKGHLWQEGTNLRAWLFTILHNQHVNHIRASLRAGTSVELHEAEPMLSRSADQDKGLELRDLKRALDRLPEDQRSVILLVGLEGMRYDAVADMLGIPVGTVRSRLSRGRETLRQLMNIDSERRAGCAAAAIANPHRRSRPLRQPPPIAAADERRVGSFPGCGDRVGGQVDGFAMAAAAGTLHVGNFRTDNARRNSDRIKGSIRQAAGRFKETVDQAVGDKTSLTEA